MKNNPQHWNNLKFLNSNNPQNWDAPLYNLLKYAKNVGAAHSDMVAYIKATSNNWNKSIPDILRSLRHSGITIEKYFELERIATFKIASLLGDINIILKHIFVNPIDVSIFVSKLSHAFLPKLVYELEEYGLPRMLSKKIQDAGIIDLERNDISVNDVICEFIKIGKDQTIDALIDIHPFEKYIIEYFYDGILSN